MEKIIIYTDGASRGNPGLSSFGFVVQNLSGKLLYQHGAYIGETTNNVAEYTAVISALKYVSQNYKAVEIEIELRADSNLVIQQLSGRFKVNKPHIFELVQRVKEIEVLFRKVTYKHIARELNKMADRVANMALDNLHS